MTLVQYKMCPKGLHEMSADNIVISRRTRGTAKIYEYKRCRACMREISRVKNAKYREEKALTADPATLNKSPLQKCPHGVQFVKDCRECSNKRKRESALRKRQAMTPEVIDVAKKTSLDYLKLTGDAAKASDRLNMAVDYTAARPLRCEETRRMVNEDGEAFNGYPHTDFAEGNEPSIVEASLLCTDCPVKELCFQFGKALRAKNVVYGGFLFNENGKPVAE